MTNPLCCERCGRDLETDDAISIIEGVCAGCRAVESAAFKGPLAPPTPGEVGPRRMYQPRTGFGASGTAASGAGRADQRAIIAAPPAPTPRRPQATRSAAASGGATTIEPPIEIGWAPAVAGGRTTGAHGASRSGRRRRDLAIGAGAGILVTVVLITYWAVNGRDSSVRPIIEPARDVSLTLMVKPPTARVLLDGEALSAIDAEGRYRVALSGADAEAQWLEVSEDGYYPIRRPVSVLGGIEDATIELVPMPFELAIRTDPPRAEVWINGTLKGVTPVTITSLPGEKATLLLRRDGYADYVKDIAAPEKGGRLDLDFQLQPATPTLLVETDPPGAMIRVNGRAAGVSPLSLPVVAPAAGGNENTTVLISAELAGHEPQERRVALAPADAGRPTVARLALKPAMIEVRVETQPPGGQITVDGMPVGPSPALVKFEKARAGQAVRIEAARGTAHAGSVAFTVPAASRVEPLVVPMAFRGARVAFVLSPRAATSAEYVTLIDQAAEQIHRLDADQQFAVFAAVDAGIERWPADGAATTATSGQKIRAFDMVRTLRPAGAAAQADGPPATSPIGEALSAAMTIEPGSIWVFAGGPISRAALAAFAESIAGRNVAVHLVTTSDAGDGAWLAAWTAQQGGTFTLLGRDPLPAIASGGRGED